MYNELIISTIPNVPVHVDRTQKPEKKAGVLSEMHLHDEIELVYVDEGRIDLIIDGKTYVAEEGTAFFINSRIPHSTVAVCDGTSGTLLQFRREDFFDKSIKKISKYLPRFAGRADTPVVLFDKESSIGGSMRGIMREYDERRNAYEAFIISGVYSILGHLYREGILADAASYYDVHALQKLLPILEYIDENYGKDLTLDHISGQFGLNASYFSRMFKKVIGSAYTEYLNFVRICKSEKLIKSTDMSILDIALEVGFSSVSYYNRVFKKIKNCTPTVYRNARYLEM